MNKSQDNEMGINEPKDSDSTTNSQLVSNTANKNTIEWSPENEMILVEWCDVAQCYKWLTTKSHAKYSSMQACMTIPAITLSTISGTASFAQASLPLNYRTYAPMVIGTINIFVGILTTVQQYLKISELNEGHRVAAISWDKFARNIRTELAKAPQERMEAGHFLKISRQEFDRMMETSPSIPQDIIKSFNSTFSGKVGSEERKRYDELKKPDLCDIIVSANENRHHWYLDIKKEDEDQNMPIVQPDKPPSVFELLNMSLNQKVELIKERENILLQREKEENKKQERHDEVQKSFQKNVKEYTHKFKEETKKIDDYINVFLNLYERKPLSEEITEKFHDSIESDFLQNYIKKYNSGNNGHDENV